MENVIFSSKACLPLQNTCTYIDFSVLFYVGVEVCMFFSVAYG